MAASTNSNSCNNKNVTKKIKGDALAIIAVFDTLHKFEAALTPTVKRLMKQNFGDSPHPDDKQGRSMWLCKCRSVVPEAKLEDEAKNWDWYALGNIVLKYLVGVFLPAANIHVTSEKAENISHRLQRIITSRHYTAHGNAPSLHESVRLLEDVSSIHAFVFSIPGATGEIPSDGTVAEAPASHLCEYLNVLTRCLNEDVADWKVSGDMYNRYALHRQFQEAEEVLNIWLRDNLKDRFAFQHAKGKKQKVELNAQQKIVVASNGDADMQMLCYMLRYEQTKQEICQRDSVRKEALTDKPGCALREMRQGRNSLYHSNDALDPQKVSTALSTVVEAVTGSPLSTEAEVISSATHPEVLVDVAQVATESPTLFRMCLPKAYPPLVGRDHEQAKLINCLERDKHASLLIRGTRGSGKTALAKELVFEMQKKHPTWLFQHIRGSSSDSLRKDLIEFAKQILPVRFRRLKGKDILVRLKSQVLESSDEWMLLLDDVTDATLLECVELLPTKKGHILATTCTASATISTSFDSGHDLAPLDTNSSVALLQSFVGDKKWKEVAAGEKDATIRQFVEDGLRNLPQAVCMAGRILRATRRITFNHLCNGYKQKTVDEIHASAPDETNLKTVWGLTQLAWTKMEEHFDDSSRTLVRLEDVKVLLCSLSVLESSGCPDTVFESQTKPRFGSPCPLVFTNEDAFKTSKGLLFEFGLVHVDLRSTSMHSLVQDAVQYLFATDVSRNVREALLPAMVSKAGSMGTSDPATALELQGSTKHIIEWITKNEGVEQVGHATRIHMKVLANALCTLHRDITGEDSESIPLLLQYEDWLGAKPSKAELLMINAQRGLTLWKTGDLKEALDATKKAGYHIFQKGNIGLILMDKGEYDQALQHAQDALEQQKRLFGEEDRRTATAWNNLAGTLIKIGDYDKATSYGEIALRIRKKWFGEEDLVTATSYDNLGLWYAKKDGSKEKALEYGLKALQVRERLLGEDNAVVARSNNNVGTIYMNLNQHEQARAYLKKAFDYYEKVGIENELVNFAGICANIGCAWRKSGNSEKALEFGLRALQIRQEKFGSNDPSTAQSHYNVGIAYSAQNKFRKALKHFRKAKDGVKGNGSLFEADSLKMFVACLLKVGLQENMHEGLSHLQRCFAIETKIQGKAAKKSLEESVLILCAIIGNIIQWRSIDFEPILQSTVLPNMTTSVQEAAPLLEQAMAVWNKLDVKLQNNIHFAATFLSVGSFLQDGADWDGSLGYFEKSVTIFQTNNGCCAEVHNMMSITYKMKEDFEKALACAQKALEIYQLYPPDEIDLAPTYSNIGSAWGGLRDFRKALEYGEKALNLRKKKFGPDDEFTAQSYHNVGVALITTNFHKARKYLQIALKIRQEQCPHHPMTANTCFQLGLLDCRFGDYANAVKLLETAIDIREQVYGSDHDLSQMTKATLKTMKQPCEHPCEHVADISAACCKGEDLLNRNRSKEALNVFLPALSDFPTAVKCEPSHFTFLSRLHLAIGDAYKQTDNWDDAYRHFRGSLDCLANVVGEVGEDCHQTLLYYQSNARLGQAATKLGRFELAYKHLREGLSIAESISYETAVNESFESFGEFWRNVKQVDQALDCWYKVLNNSRNEKQLAKIHYNIGCVWMTKREFDKARMYLRKCLAIEERILAENDISITLTLKRAGLCCLEQVMQGEYLHIFQGLQYFQRARIRTEKILGLNHIKLVELYFKIGQMHYLGKSYREACAHFQVTKSLCERYDAFDTNLRPMKQESIGFLNVLGGLGYRHDCDNCLRYIEERPIVFARLEDCKVCTQGLYNKN